VVKRIDSAYFLAGSLLSFFGGSNELRQCTGDRLKNTLRT